MASACVKCGPGRTSSGPTVNGAPVCDCNIEKEIFEPVLNEKEQFQNVDSYVTLRGTASIDSLHSNAPRKVVFGPDLADHGSVQTILDGGSGDVISIPNFAHNDSGDPEAYSHWPDKETATMTTRRYRTHIYAQLNEAHNFFSIGFSFIDFSGAAGLLPKDMTKPAGEYLLNTESSLMIPLTSVTEVVVDEQSMSLTLMLSEPMRVFKKQKSEMLSDTLCRAQFQAVKTVADSGAQFDDEECLICCVELSAGTVTKMPCGCKTMYCKGCVEKLFKKGHTSCPTCRGFADQCAVDGQTLARMAGGETTQVRIFFDYDTSLTSSTFHPNSIFYFCARLKSVVSRIEKVRKQIKKREKNARRRERQARGETPGPSHTLAGGNGVQDEREKTDADSKVLQPKDVNAGTSSGADNAGCTQLEEIKDLLRRIEEPQFT